VKRLQEVLREHAIDKHTRDCPAHHSRCECGHDTLTPKLLKQAANRIDDLEQELRDGQWRPEEQEK